ncbi:MAG: hypothetical protein ACI4MK_08330 [Aristaeellaceae bacterium]
MKKAILFLLTICMLLGSAAQAIVAPDPILDLTDCLGMDPDVFNDFLRENERYNPSVRTSLVITSDGEGQTRTMIERLTIADTGFAIHGLHLGTPYEVNSDLLTSVGWTEVQREYDGDFSFVYEMVVGEATYRLAVQTLNMQVSGLDYSVDNLDAHFANLAAEATEE